MVFALLVFRAAKEPIFWSNFPAKESFSLLLAGECDGAGYFCPQGKQRRVFGVEPWQGHGEDLSVQVERTVGGIQRDNRFRNGTVYSFTEIASFDREWPQWEMYGSW